MNFPVHVSSLEKSPTLSFQNEPPQESAKEKEEFFVRLGAGQLGSS